MCSETFKSKGELNGHCQVRHGEKPVRNVQFTCSTCGKALKTVKTLKRHKLIHSGEKPFICACCEKGFLDKDRLTQHLKIHTEKFACKHCEKTFSTKSSLNLHINLHKDEKPFACVQCNKRFFKNQYLKAHMRRHSGEKPYACSPFGMRKVFYEKKQYLNNHQRRHTDENTFLCEFCSKTFDTNGSLSRHILKHGGEKPFYDCRFCTKTFSSKQYVGIHVKRVHFGEKPFTCNMCQKTFSSSLYLKKHTRNVHTLEKCLFQMRFQILLEMCLTKTHTNSYQKPFTCNMCHKTFSSSFELTDSFWQFLTVYTSFWRFLTWSRQKPVYDKKLPTLIKLIWSQIKRNIIFLVTSETGLWQKIANPDKVDLKPDRNGGELTGYCSIEKITSERPATHHLFNLLNYMKVKVTEI